MSRAGRIIRDPRFVRRKRTQKSDPVDGFVSHVLFKEIVFDVVWRLYRLDILKDGRSPLAGITAYKSVEVFEA